jgi:hypothetical protein
MSKRKQITNACPIDLVRAARAGLIPASDDIAAEKRARMSCTARMIRIEKVNLGTVTRVSDDRAIASILADLRHYCDWKGLAFRKCYAAACALYFQDEADGLT